MTQESITLNTTPPYSGADLVDDLNKALQSLGTDFAGSVDPAAVGGVGPYVTWADTANGLLKRRNAAGTAWEVEGVLFVQPLPIYAEVDIPVSDIGPIYVIGKGAYDWDGVSAYAPALIFYNNTSSGLTATDVQGAIDELAGSGKVLQVKTFYDAGGSTSSGSYADLNSVAFEVTPKKDDSLIIVTANFEGSAPVVSTVNTLAYFELNERTTASNGNFLRLGVTTGAGGNGIRAPCICTIRFDNNDLTTKEFFLRGTRDTGSYSISADKISFTAIEVAN